MEFYKEDYLIIECDEDSGSTIMRWSESPSTDQYREGNEKVLEALEKGDSPNLLIDLEKLNIIMSLSDQVWTAKEWLPKVFERKVSKLAVVTPSSFVTQIAIKSIYGALPQDEIQLGFFDEFDEASEWIGEVAESSSSGTADGW